MSATIFSIEYLEQLLIKNENRKVCSICKHLWLNPAINMDYKSLQLYELATRKAHYEEYKLPLIRQGIRDKTTVVPQMELDWMLYDAQEELRQRNIEKAENHLRKAMLLCDITIEINSDNKIVDNAVKISGEILDKVDHAKNEVEATNFAQILTLKGRIAYMRRDFKSALIYFVQANELWWKKCYGSDDQWKISNMLFILKSLSADKADKSERKVIRDCIVDNVYLDFDAEYDEDVLMAIDFDIGSSNRFFARLAYYHFGNAVHDWLRAQLFIF